MAGLLQGIRVIELGQLLAGPFCGRLLADYGAEVIKIDHFAGWVLSWALTTRRSTWVCSA